MMNLKYRITQPISSQLAKRPTFAGVRLYSAALLTLGAAFIHLAVAPEHLREYAPFGVFFLGVGSAQIVLAVELLSRPTRKLSAFLATMSVALVGLWFISRTVGLPIGPTPGRPEDIGLTDVVCNIMEVLSSVLFLSLTAWPARRTLRRVWLVAIGTIPGAFISFVMTAVAVAATLSGMPEAVNAAPPVAGQSTTSITSLVEQPGTEPLKRFTLTAGVEQLNGQQVWALNDSVPGPELRVNQGDRVQVTLINHLPESTTLHWHGVVLPNAEDGVAGVTQDAVAPGATYTYEFVAREAGTYWYHSHQQTESQLPKGLFGSLVVLPSEGLSQQRDYTVMLHGTSGLVSINGVADDLHLDAQPGDTVRLRLINAVAPGMDGGPEAPVLIGAPAQVVALDGRDLNAPEWLGPTRIQLGMGQRADLVFTMPASGSVRLIDTELSGETSAVQNFFTSGQQPSLASVTIGDGQSPEPTDANAAPLLDALHYGAPAADTVAAATPDQTLAVVLAEHGGMRDGRPQLIHTINGEASPNVPPITVEEGQIVRLHIVNDTAEYHPMHLHGHVFSVIAIDGQSVEGSPLHLDSVLVAPHQTVDVAFAANNPGVWMFHCHVLLHAGMGMTSSINYVGYSTPFEMGTRSGNMPE
jgi:FtsP/CotA-like multicopper oxidase with cupredoxin domain